MMLLILLSCFFSSLSFANEPQATPPEQANTQSELKFEVEVYTEQAAGGYEQILMRRLKAVDAQGNYVGRAEIPAQDPCWLSNLVVNKEFKGKKYSVQVWQEYLRRAQQYKCKCVRVLARPGTYWYFHRLGARKVADPRNSNQAFSGFNLIQYDLPQKDDKSGKQ